MKTASDIRGALYAYGASLTLAASLAISKSLLNHISIIKLGLIWFSLSTIFNLIIYSVRSQRDGIFIHPGMVWRTALIIAFPDAIASFLFFLAIQKMENPAVVSFIGNLGPVIVTISGITLLKERYSLLQVAGIILTLTGVFLLSFGRGRIIQPGSEYVITAAFLFAACTIIARRSKDFLHPQLLSTLRSFILFSFCCGWFLLKGEDLKADIGIWIKLASGSFLESVLTIVLNYQALKYMEAAKTSLILSSKALWLLVIAYAFLGVVPPLFHVISGILTITGLILISRKTLIT